MGILIKNPEAERAVRELAGLTGESLTTAVEVAVRERLAKQHEARPHRARTIEEMREATDRFRRAVGLDKVKLNVTKADFDELNEIPGLDTTDPE
ncbi:type II toxin-antitoxin system VapB family antitoxin [Caulobacter sp. DWR2-3-1b2]|uniref:type II toxin-antitoxin system VapB family antitoxin n=1 Tax=unclassified Caulobacter TaxID=2648921 RepID=UPI00199C50D4|nr:type II toxin-antitoxin system VapB family antitoxin [Caulobacter sp.]